MDNQVDEMDFETFIKNTTSSVVGTSDKQEIVATEESIAQKIKERTTIKHRGKIILPTKIDIRPSPIHNQGVFAEKDILIGETIEIAPLLQLGWRFQYQTDPIIKKYMWLNMECKCRDCKLHSPLAFIPLGYGSLYNHSDTPNVDVNIDWMNHTATFTAKETIIAGSELFINYGDYYWKNNNEQKK